MATFIFRLFGALFEWIGFLIITGSLISALIDIQSRAFDHKHTGLVSMLKINQQLVGKTK